MVARTSFFVASLWAPLPPVGMMVGACLWVLMFPGTVGLGGTGRDAAGVALIAVPFAYTVISGATYITARALHALHVLSLWALLGVCGVVSLAAGALVFADVVIEAPRPMLWSGIVFAVSFVALASAALVWWRVGVRTPPLVGAYERKRSRSRRKREEANANAAASGQDGSTDRAVVASDELIVRWDPKARRLQVVHPDRSRFPAPLAEVTEQTLNGMSPEEATQLIGAFFTMLIPDLRAKYGNPRAPEDKQKG